MDIVTFEEAVARGLKRYFTGQPCKNGHISARSVDRRYCLECDRVRKRGSKDRARSARRYKRQSQEALMLRRAKGRAAVAGIKFEITLSDIKIPLVCPVLGTPLAHRAAGTGKGPQWSSPSLDRIIPELGYVPGNVVVVSHRANSIKSNATPEQIRAVADFYAPLVQQLRHVHT